MCDRLKSHILLFLEDIMAEQTVSRLGELSEAIYKNVRMGSDLTLALLPKVKDEKIKSGKIRTVLPCFPLPKPKPQRYANHPRQKQRGVRKIPQKRKNKQQKQA